MDEAGALISGKFMIKRKKERRKKTERKEERN